eukprot:1370927-Prymnesium_polylepis.1
MAGRGAAAESASCRRPRSFQIPAARAPTAASVWLAAPRAARHAAGAGAASRVVPHGAARVQREAGAPGSAQRRRAWRAAHRLVRGRSGAGRARGARLLLGPAAECEAAGRGGRARGAGVSKRRHLFEKIDMIVGCPIWDFLFVHVSV